MEKLSKIYTNFGDIIYALIIGSSFTFLQEQLFPFNLSFNTFTIFLAYATVVQSWIGYHLTVSMHEYRNSFRFILDLIIWFLLFSLLYTSSNFNEYIKIFPFIFFFLMLWRYGVIREVYTRNGVYNTLRALKIVLIYVITSSVIVVVHDAIQPVLPEDSVMLINGIILALMYCEVFFYYRLRHKDRISSVLTKLEK